MTMGEEPLDAVDEPPRLWLPQAAPCSRLRYQHQPLAIGEIRLFTIEPYWSRLWIRQEILLSEPIVCAGSKGCKWKNFRVFFRLYLTETWSLKSSLSNDLRSSPLNSLMDLWAISQRTNSQTRFNWREAIPLAQQGQCYDVKDKVFGSLGLVRDEVKIDPDYNQSPRLIFFAILKRETATLGSRYWVFPDVLEEMTWWRDVLGLRKWVRDQEIVKALALQFP